MYKNKEVIQQQNKWNDVITMIWKMDITKYYKLLTVTKLNIQITNLIEAD